MRNALLIWSIAMMGLCAPRLFAAEDEPQQAAPVEDPVGSHRELDPLEIEFERLSALCLHPNGNLLACDAAAKAIKVIDPSGKQVATFKLDFGPFAVDTDDKGTIYCGGHDQLAKLDPCGKVLATAQIEERAESQSDTPKKKSREPRVSGIAVCGEEVFVAFGSGWSLRSKSKLYRFDRELNHPTLIAEGLRGCCQRCDVAAYGGELYLAENSAFRIVRFDREGKELGKWGSRDRKAVEGFAACCNPMNLCFDGQGVLYTAESGPGRVKRYSRDGEFLGLVGHAGVDRFERAGGFAASCSNIAIAATPDGKRVYVMDYRNNVVRVLEK